MADTQGSKFIISWIFRLNIVNLLKNMIDIQWPRVYGLEIHPEFFYDV